MAVPPQGGSASFTAKASPAVAGGSIAPPRNKNSSLNSNGYLSGPGNASTPLSARIAEPLDMKSVERRGQPSSAREIPKRIRPHNLQEAPTYRPSEEQFEDPMRYIQSIAAEGSQYGIVKIIPPDGWNPDFAIDTERFHFRTRRQELNSVEGGTRSNLNYLDQLAKFHRQHGTNLNRFPSVDKRPLDLYKLKKAVEVRGGFDKVCKLKKWAEIGRDLGYSGKIMSSLSTSLKNSYQRWLNPYEAYLKIAKPGVQQQLEYENGGPLTPSPGQSPMKKQAEPLSVRADSPAVKASQALNSSFSESAPPKIEAPRPISMGFTAVNSGGGFTAVNSSFASSHMTNGAKHSPEVTPSRSGDSPLDSAKNTPEFRPSGLANATTTNGTTNHMKRQLSQDSPSVSSGKENGDSLDEEGKERRSKRIKREPVPRVAGSHMSLYRPSTPKMLKEVSNLKPGERCEACKSAEDGKSLLLCDSCDHAYHPYCLDPPAQANPDHSWHCPRCLVGTGEFGFEDGGIYSLKSFQLKAHNFKENHFLPKMPFDPVLNCKRPVTEDDVEREFWRLVESLTETVEVEYGADIHSTTHGSGFPTIEKNRLNPYSTDPWNLNVLPLHPDSLFRHIKSDISGMTVPWLYVGMCFSTFCWHNEDHYTYSANYQHFGATKTWYGIPGEDAEKFEAAMREAVPELFETQPDLLFQLVTLLPPDQLRKAGVRVYAVDQRAGQFVITFPQAYHAGFNHGFNFNEAVNFAPSDWEKFGVAGVERLQAFKRQPCFSHDELIYTAASQEIKDISIKTARWLAPALGNMKDRELALRSDFTKRHRAIEHQSCNLEEQGMTSSSKCNIALDIDPADASSDEYQCSFCKAYTYLSRFKCKRSNKLVCLLHAGVYECCESTEEERLTDHNHVLVYKFSDEHFDELYQTMQQRATAPEIWTEKYNKALGDGPKPSLKMLKSLLNEGEKINYDVPDLTSLKEFVDRCNEWVEEATNYIVRKQQNRRKNEKVWRKSNSAKAAEMEEREREHRNVENIQKLLKDAELLSFDCPEIIQLQERADAIEEFRRDARRILENPMQVPIDEIEELVEAGKGFNVDIAEVEELDRAVRRRQWEHEASDKMTDPSLSGQPWTLARVSDLIKQASELGISETHERLTFIKEQKLQGEIWEAKAKELMAVESIHYQQLEALALQASQLPVTQETYSAVDQILNKQREAHKQIISMFERSKDPEVRKRPKYKDVRELMETLVSKPTGTVDLEKEQKRHEDWMRKGKKLFGKANAPLHILAQHMAYVETHNHECFNLDDKPRLPVEPSSRGQTPEDGNGSFDETGRTREVFCICRAPEAGMMIECELCHEWYHCRCLKIARGKVKEDEKYKCPICDWRVRIPRDAARPKLEDLQDWQAEIPSLPFQPDEEECLANIVNKAQAFRDFIRPYINPVMATSEEVNTQQFYLRKIEGAEILLAWETNFFRQELHRLAPVANEPPPVLEVSLSTRKPRPTKQQKIMAQMGISNPEDIPPSMRPKSHAGGKRKSQEPSSAQTPSSSNRQKSKTVRAGTNADSRHSSKKNGGSSTGPSLSTPSQPNYTNDAEQPAFAFDDGYIPRRRSSLLASPSLPAPPSTTDGLRTSKRDAAVDPLLRDRGASTEDDVDPALDFNPGDSPPPLPPHNDSDPLENNPFITTSHGEDAFLPTRAEHSSPRPPVPQPPSDPPSSPSETWSSPLLNPNALFGRATFDMPGDRELFGEEVYALETAAQRESEQAFREEKEERDKMSVERRRVRREKRRRERAEREREEQEVNVFNQLVGDDDDEEEGLEGERPRTEVLGNEHANDVLATMESAGSEKGDDGEGSGERAPERDEEEML